MARAASCTARSRPSSWAARRGGFLPPEVLDTPLTFGPLAAAGALAGSGTLLALDETTCIVDLATLMTRYLGDEACGKTIPCRIGMRRLAELGDGFCSGRVPAE